MGRLRPDYKYCKTDPSVSKFTDAAKVPAYLAKAKSDKYEPVSDYASFEYYEEPECDNEPLPLHPFVKEPMKYAVYSSSPEAYAELKNWGVASYNEPGDTTGLGDGRSPVDTELGVKPSTASNGSDRINEDYEAMAGVPTTEKLYLAVGGSEFIIDIAVQYVPNETAVRTYHVHFDGVDSQYNYPSVRVRWRYLADLLDVRCRYHRIGFNAVYQVRGHTKAEQSRYDVR